MIRKFSFFGIHKKFFFQKIFGKVKPNTQEAELSKSELIKNEEILRSKIEATETNESQIAVQEKKEVNAQVSKEIETINSIYKSYNKPPLLKKDPQFGEVVKYDDFLDRGLEKFDNIVSNYYSTNKHLEKNKDFVDLMKIIDNKKKMIYTNYKEEYKYKLEKSEERWYKEAIHSTKKEDYMEFIHEDDFYKKTKKVSLRNLKDETKDIEMMTIEPDHPRLGIKFQTEFENFVDYFDYVRDINSKETNEFITREQFYRGGKLLKFQTHEIHLLREFNDSVCLSDKRPIELSKNHLVYQKENDDLTLYSQNPNDINDKGNYKSYPIESEKIIFSLNDFVNLNKAIEDVDMNILEFTKRLLEKIEEESDDPFIINCRLCPNEQYLIVVFNLFPETSTYSYIIKDIKNNVIIPSIIHNVDGKFAFDNIGGLYYTELDLKSRPYKVFRHQIGKNRKTDNLIYHEKNHNFKVSTSNDNSQEFIYIDISTVATPENNEIWFKTTNEKDFPNQDFTCMRKIQKNIKYSLKYSNGSFFMLINKLNSYDQELKRIIYLKPKISGLIGYSDSNIKSKIKNISHNLQEKSEDNYANLPTINLNLPNIAEPNTIKQNDERGVGYYDELLNSDNKLIPRIQTMLKLEDESHVIDFELFNDNLVILEEKSTTRHISVKNFKTQKNFIHEPILNYFDVNLIENFSKDSQTFRYRVSSVTDLPKTFEFNFEKRENKIIHTEFYDKFKEKNYKSELIHISDRNNETRIPVHLFYNPSLMSKDSPYIYYTQGSESTKSILNFDDKVKSMIDKGFVWVVPQIRGTKFFNFNWFVEGSAEKKLNHFTDLIDVVEHFKSNDISKKNIFFGEGNSGGLTGAACMFQEPELFDQLYLLNGVYDLLDYININRNDVNAIEEFGDFSMKNYYELIKLYSPYHLTIPKKHPMVFFMTSKKERFCYHTLKLAGKMRTKNKILKNGNEIYVDFMYGKNTREEVLATIFSTMVGQSFLKDKY